MAKPEQQQTQSDKEFGATLAKILDVNSINEDDKMTLI